MKILPSPFSTLCLTASVAAFVLCSSDAHAQRRRRRPTSGTQTTQQNSTDPAGTSATAAATGATGTSATTTATATATGPVSATPDSTAAAAGATTAAPVNPEPVPVAPPPVVPPVVREAVAVPPRPPVIDAELGGGIAGRSIFFTDDLFMRLRPYSVAIVPALRAAVQFYPGALFSTGVASMFGLVANGEYSFLFSSTDRQGRAYPTLSFSVSGGIRWRYRLGERIEFGATLGYQLQNFTIDRSAVMQAPADGLPNVTYHALRFALDGRFAIVSRLALLVGGSYLLPLATGEISGPQFFPRSNAGGADANLAVAIGLARGLELRVGGEWRRFFFKMNPMFNDPLIAGGAADDSYRATVSIAIRR